MRPCQVVLFVLFLILITIIIKILYNFVSDEHIDVSAHTKRGKFTEKGTEKNIL